MSTPMVLGVGDSGCDQSGFPSGPSADSVWSVPDTATEVVPSTSVKSRTLAVPGASFAVCAPV